LRSMQSVHPAQQATRPPRGADKATIAAGRAAEGTTSGGVCSEYLGRVVSDTGDDLAFGRQSNRCFFRIWETILSYLGDYPLSFFLSRADKSLFVICTSLTVTEALQHSGHSVRNHPDLRCKDSRNLAPSCLRLLYFQKRVCSCLFDAAMMMRIQLQTFNHNVCL
jgi:hypothetical protein